MIVLLKKLIQFSNLPSEIEAWIDSFKERSLMDGYILLFRVFTTCKFGNLKLNKWALIIDVCSVLLYYIVA